MSDREPKGAGRGPGVVDADPPRSTEAGPPEGGSPEPEGAEVPARAGHGPGRGRLSLGPAVLSAAFGVQLTLGAVLLFPFGDRDTGRLTRFGLVHYHPDHDSAIYLVSILAATLLNLAAVAFLVRRGRLSERPAPAGARWRAPGLQVFVAVAGSATSVAAFLQARAYLAREEAVPPGYLWAIGTACLLCAVAVFAGRTTRDGEGQARDPGGAATPRLAFSPWDVAAPLAIVAAVYVTEWRLLAGRFLLEESLGHWDFFVMAPALAFSNGLDLASDASTMYGVGWPMLLGFFLTWVEPSFGRLIQLGSVYACIYLAGTYLLFRLLTRRVALAALGTVVVASHLYLGFEGSSIWRYPSMTVLRSPFDVWCFVALVLHWRTGRRAWAAAAGVFTGLAVVFGTDTGLCLAAAGGFYWVALLRMDGDRRARLGDAAGFGAALLGSVAVSLLAATHGRIFSGAFWRGWLESILEFGQGYIGVPLSTGPKPGQLLIFAVVFFAYLVCFAHAFARVALRRIDQAGAFNGFLALYGLLEMLQFLGKSDRFHLRLAIPLVVIAVSLAGGRVRPARNRKERLAIGLAAAALAVVVATALPPAWLLDPVRAYPSLASAAFAPPADGGVCLVRAPKDVCGLPGEMAPAAAEFRMVAREVAELTRSGSTVAVIGETGSLPYLAAGTAPWSRYPRMFVLAFTKSKQAELSRELVRNPADVVLLRLPAESKLLEAPAAEEQHPAPTARDYEELYRALVFGAGPVAASPYADTWDELISRVHEQYRQQGTLGPYEVWTIAPAAG